MQICKSKELPESRVLDPYQNVPDPDPAIFFLITYRIDSIEGTFTSFFKDKKLERSHKTVFLTIFA